jgi:hypothetical protein
MKKLEEILGNPVRLEAALKFYNRYYGTFTPSVPPIVESTFTPE